MYLTRTRSTTVLQFVNGNQLLFSFDTPVAWYDAGAKLLYLLDEKVTKTTSHHISAFRKAVNANVVFRDAPWFTTLLVDAKEHEHALNEVAEEGYQAGLRRAGAKV